MYSMIYFISDYKDFKVYLKYFPFFSKSWWTDKIEK